MSTPDFLTNFIINENAYFYRKTNRNLSNTFLSRVFRNVSSEKEGHYLQNDVGIDLNTPNYNAKYSICVFKFSRKPSFIVESISGWYEVKLAYLLIIEYKDFVVISKKNISGLGELLKKLELIPPNEISNAFIDNNTSFEKFSMRNTNIGSNSIRQKSLEAIDLQESLSTLGASSYTLDIVRLKNGPEKIGIALNTSRINSMGMKKTINQFADWANSKIRVINSYVIGDSYLSIFTTPLKFEDERRNLTPRAILFHFFDLQNAIEQGEISDFFYVLEDERRRRISLYNIFKEGEKSFNIIPSNDTSDRIFNLEQSFISDLKIRLNNNSISIKSEKLKKIEIEYESEDGQTEDFLNFLNKRGDFVVTFEQPDLVYTYKKLFRNNNLLGNINTFLDVFKPLPSLETVRSEKGVFSEDSTEFSEESIFKVVEDEFLEDSQFFILDDLGNEWADHIGLYENKISFFHSKFKNSRFSASAFHDVIGQAQKNFGNMSPRQEPLQRKESSWDNYFRINEVTTAIYRLRKGDSVQGAINYFIELGSNPNLRKEVCLVINFISKSELSNRLEQLRDNVPFAEKNEVVQILWFVSAFISACKEINADILIYCKA